MSSLIVIVSLIAVYFVSQEALRRKGLFCIWTLFGVLPVALTAYWSQNKDFDLFLWVKLYTILFCICWGNWLRFTSHGTNPWFLRTIPVLLAANILEAMTVDILKFGLAHSLNAVTGALLLVALPFGATCVRFDLTSKHRDMRFDTSLTWIVGYTLWNWSFMYLNYPSLMGHHSAILATALIVAMIDPQRWLQTRAATLGMSLILTATSYSGMLNLIDTTCWFQEHIAIAVAIFAFGWMLVHVLNPIRSIRQIRGLKIEILDWRWNRPSPGRARLILVTRQLLTRI